MNARTTLGVHAFARQPSHLSLRPSVTCAATSTLNVVLGQVRDLQEGREGMYEADGFVDAETLELVG